MKKNFFWGNSVSSMQTEGAWNIDGKGKSVYDVRKGTDTTSDWKDGIDSYNRYKEDFDLLKEMGANFYRFQISWSRVCPSGDGEFNEKGIDFYNKFIDELLKRGIEPMICLYHFDMPLNLAEKYNGFISKETTAAFVRFGKKMIQEFSHKVKYWVTFNEQNLFSTPLSFEIGGNLNAEESIENLYKIQHNVLVAHCRVANYLHETTSDCQIGGMIAYSEMYPASSNPKDVFIARKWDEFINFNIVDSVTGRGYSNEVLTYINNYIGIEMESDEIEDIMKVRSDFISFSYYCSGVISAENITTQTPPNYYLSIGEKNNKYIPTNKWGFGYDALGFRNIMNKLYQRYNLPIFPVENGIGLKETWNDDHFVEDDYRIVYHQDHIKAMIQAVEEDGVDVIGYLGWGLIDILSSKGDMEKRYGAVFVDRGNHELRTMDRYPKKSFAWFKSVYESNGAFLKNESTN